MSSHLLSMIFFAFSQLGWFLYISSRRSSLMIITKNARARSIRLSATSHKRHFLNIYTYIRSTIFLLCKCLLNIIFLIIWIFTLALSKLQRDFVATSDFAHWMYYVDVLDPHIHNQNVLESLCNNAIKSVKKEHMTPFNKSLPMCDLALGLEFLQQV